MPLSEPTRFKLEVKPYGTLSRFWLGDQELTMNTHKVEVVTQAGEPSMLRIELLNVEGEIEGEAFTEQKE